MAGSVGFSEEQRGDGQHDRRDGEHEESPPPACRSACGRCDGAYDYGAAELPDGAPHAFGGEDSGTGSQRVLVGKQRRVHGQAVGLSHACEDPGPEELEDVHHRAHQGDCYCPESSGGRDDASALDAVGQPSHRHCAQHDGNPAHARHAQQHGVGDIQGLLDVGSEHGDGNPVELVDDVEQEQDGEHAHPALPESLPQGHRVAADAWKEVVGEDGDRVAFGLLGLALGFLL